MSQSSPDERAAELAALYVSGSMSRGEREAFETELLSGNETYRDAVTRYDRVVRSLVAAIEPVTPSDETRDAIMELAASESGPNAAENGHRHVWRDWTRSEDETCLYTLPAVAGQWEPTGIDGIDVRRLFVDRANNRMTAMFRMAPGTAYVPHVHDGPEECFVLEGDLHVGEDIVMHAGDYQRAPAGSLHGVQRTEGGCLLLVSSSMEDEVV